MLKLDSDRHEILGECEWTRFLERRCGARDLFVYRHKETEKFVLCQWRDRLDGRCQELEVMDLPPDRGGWVDTAFMELRLKPQDELNRQMAARVREQREGRQRKRRENVLAKHDAAETYRRMGKADVAAGILSGGWEQPSEQTQELAKDLTNKARGRVVVGGGGA